MIKEILSSLHFHLVTDHQTLSDVCRKAQEKSTVALDTEFVRIRTLYPQLGLIQLYDGEQVSLIDPLSIQDFSPFIELLANEKVTKVLHASSEDLEVFQHYFHQLPQPMCDTQIVASFLKFGNSTGLATLIKHYFQLELDKGTSRTDWLARPLSEKQLYYAAADVWYLLPLYQRMQHELVKSGWQSAVEYDCKMLLKKRGKTRDSEHAYLAVSNAWRLTPLELMRLKLLAKWRQEEAMKRDLALNFVVKSEHLYLVAKNNPKNTSQMLELGLLTQEVRIHGKKMLQLLEQVKRINESEYPEPIVRVAEDPRYRKMIKVLQQKLKEITPPDLNSEVIASKKSLEQLMKWVWIKQQDPDQLPELLCDWRYKFGEKLLKSLQDFK